MHLKQKKTSFWAISLAVIFYGYVSSWSQKFLVNLLQPPPFRDPILPCWMFLKPHWNQIIPGRMYSCSSPIPLVQQFGEWDDAKQSLFIDTRLWCRIWIQNTDPHKAPDWTELSHMASHRNLPLQQVWPLKVAWCAIWLAGGHNSVLTSSLLITSSRVAMQEAPFLSLSCQFQYYASGWPFGASMSSL